MNITGGTFNRKKLTTSPLNDIRPTSARVREALFSCLSGKIQDCSFVDLYAGNGTVGLEALSRGAAHVMFVEKRREGVDCIKRNVKSFPDQYANKCNVIFNDCLFFLKNPTRPHYGYDIIFLDPPYYRDEELKSTCPQVAQELLAAKALNPGGVIVCQYERGAVDWSTCTGLTVDKEKHYGRTTLAFITH